MNNFKLTKTSSNARAGLLKTKHGTIETPVFMPVATAGAIKGVLPRQVKESGASVILSNTYHLMLRPGVEAVEQIGGLHKLNAWPGPILTDSGGYQVFSLSKLAKINDQGVEFASHIDGQKLKLNAEIATNIQNRLGADIIMCFDQCAPYPCNPDLLKTAMKRSIKWAKRCKDAHANPDQLLFGIVQGGTDLKSRAVCSEKLMEIGFDGYALGGLSVGEGHEIMIKTVQHTAPLLPDDKPRYLMGVGTPADILAAVNAGIDMFDCVMPTRNGRNAYAFTEQGPVRMRNNTHITDTSPIEDGCPCYCCQNFTRGAIRHFFKSKEMLGPILVSIHNLFFYQRLMKNIRLAIEKDRFPDFYNEKIEKYKIFNK